MQIVTSYEIASANFALALESDTVSTEQRTEIRAAIGDSLDNLIDAVNMLLVAYNRKYYAGRITAAKAIQTIKAEYKACKFNELLEYGYIERLVEIFYKREDFPNANTVQDIKAIYEKNLKCPQDRIRAGVDSYCLRLLSHCGAVTTDLHFTQELMNSLNCYTREQMDESILPACLVTEL